MMRAVGSGSLHTALDIATETALTDAFASSTAAGQRSAEVAWNRYLAAVNFVLPGCWSNVGLLDMEALLIGFVCFEVSLRGLSPLSTCTSYVPHIANSFAINNIVSCFHEASQQRRYKLVARGFINCYNRANPKCERAKAAFCLDMTIGAFWVRTGYLASLCYTAMRFGIFFLLRKGEFLHIQGMPNTGIRRSHVCFFTEHDIRIPYRLIGSSLYPPAHSVRIQVTFSKTDQSGFGRLLKHIRQPGPNHACIVTELEKFVAYSRDNWKIGVDDFFFVDADGTPLRSDVISSCMKDIAATLGIDTTKVSAHSLRYGGASLLASFGLPQYIIAYYGGWKEDSETLRLYARPSTGSMAIVSDCFAKGRADGEVAARIAKSFGHNPIASGEWWV